MENYSHMCLGGDESQQVTLFSDLCHFHSEYTDITGKTRRWLCVFGSFPKAKLHKSLAVSLTS